MFSDISIHCVHFCAQTTKEIHLTHHTSDLLDYLLAIIITSIHAAYKNNQKKSFSYSKAFFMQINNIVIDGLGGLSLFIHKSFRRSETLFCKQRRMRFIIVLINLFGNAYRCSNLTFIWSQLIPTMGEPKSSLMLAKILGSL